MSELGPDGSRGDGREELDSHGDRGTVYGRVTRFGAAPGPGPGPQAPGWPPPASQAPPGAPPWGAVAAPPAGPGPGGVGGYGPWAPAPGGQPWTAFPPPWSPAPPPPSWPAEAYATWGRRVLSTLVDNIPGYVAGGVLLASYVPLYVGLLRGDLGARPHWVLLVVGIVLYLAAFGWQVYNRWIVAGRTGQSAGKRVMKTWLVSARDGRPVGPLNAFLRDLLHTLDGMSYVGYLWPLWDARRQTFADMVLETVVVRTPVAPLTAQERSTRT